MAMTGELQQLSDSIGSRLKRAVAIDDPHMRLLAYSSHYGRVDPVRTASIMHRRAPKAATDWINAQGVRHAQSAVRLPANPELAMDPRVCAPIRCQGELLGFLWLIETDVPLSEVDLQFIDDMAGAIGGVLYRERLLHEADRANERDLVRKLIFEQREVADQAATQLIESGLIVPAKSVAVVVVRPTARTEDGDGYRIAVGLALERVRHSLAPRHAIQLVRVDHGLLLAAMEGPVLRAHGLDGLARLTTDAVAQQFKDRKLANIQIGLGSVQPTLSDAAVSYRQAMQATQVAELIPSYRPCAKWADLGIYCVLLRFQQPELAADGIHRGLREVIERFDDEVLARTLETYFDRGCDAQTTSRELKVHRATLYYRLHRIEQMTGLDLRSGDDRLLLHLGIKLSHIAGLRPYTNQGEMTGGAGVESKGTNKGAEALVH